MNFFKTVLFVTVFAIPVYLTVNFLTEDRDNSWQTYQKSTVGISIHSSTERELKKARVVLPPKKSTKRLVASIPKTKREIKTRIILGKINNDTIYLNKPSKDWKKIYAQGLLSRLSEDSKVLIKKKSGMIRVIAGKAKYIEQVQVSIHTSEGSPPNSFEAQVDSETGEQLSVWNRTNFEYGGNGFSIKKKLDL
jgi:hypothetical protein